MYAKIPFVITEICRFTTTPVSSILFNVEQLELFETTEVSFNATITEVSDEVQ